MKILLVEQERSLLNALQRLLSVKGHDVQVAFDGVIAINEFDDGVDLVIIDENNPRIVFSETVNLLKQKKENLHFIALLDQLIVPYEYLKNNQNINAYMVRPFQAETLLSLIEEIDKFDYQNHLTFYELKLVELLKEKDLAPYSLIKETLKDEIDSLDNYIKSINEKLEKQMIVHDEKGFKLVDKND